MAQHHVQQCSICNHPSCFGIRHSGHAAASNFNGNAIRRGGFRCTHNHGSNSKNLIPSSPGPQVFLRRAGNIARAAAITQVCSAAAAVRDRRGRGILGPARGGRFRAQMRRHCVHTLWRSFALGGGVVVVLKREGPATPHTYM